MKTLKSSEIVSISAFINPSKPDTVVHWAFTKDGKVYELRNAKWERIGDCAISSD